MKPFWSGSSGGLQQLVKNVLHFSSCREEFRSESALLHPDASRVGPQELHHSLFQKRTGFGRAVSFEDPGLALELHQFPVSDLIKRLQVVFSNASYGA